MSDRSKISWTDATWEPVTGCTPISEGCRSCYAKRLIEGRLSHLPRFKDGFKVTLHEDRLDQPLRWTKPRRIFVVSQGDLFHEDVPDDFINRVWNVAYTARQHTYFFLTKRPGRMLDWTRRAAWAKGWPIQDMWPDWMWNGVTAETQRRANERIPILLNTPAAHRFVSCEPLLGLLSLKEHVFKLDWVICGGESGPRRREMDDGWARLLRDECRGVVPFHFKQHSGPRPGWKPELDGVRHTAMPPFEGARCPE